MPGVRGAPGQRTGQRDILANYILVQRIYYRNCDDTDPDRSFDRRRMFAHGEMIVRRLK